MAAVRSIRPQQCSLSSRRMGAIKPMSTRAPAESRRVGLQPLTRLPVFFALAGRRAVLAGGTGAAVWKAELLSAAGAQVDVYASDIGDDMRALAAQPPRGLITL